MKNLPPENWTCGQGTPAAGCSSSPLPVMHYGAPASPAFLQRHFNDGVGAGSMAKAPSQVFNNKGVGRGVLFGAAPAHDAARRR
ncbi:hypothetical protein PO002_42145 [Cupriavidus necator]|uniref:hypothetical protein n=1 Tax=Cupriavidus necator TaxID=106590 RepID=UPI0039C0712B